MLFIYSLKDELSLDVSKIVAWSWPSNTGLVSPSPLTPDHQIKACFQQRAHWIRVCLSSAQCWLRSSSLSRTVCVALQSLHKPKPEAFARQREQLEKTSGKTQRVVLKIENSGSSEDDEIRRCFVGLVYSVVFFFFVRGLLSSVNYLHRCSQSSQSVRCWVAPLGAGLKDFLAPSKLEPLKTLCYLQLVISQLVFFFLLNFV